MSKKNYISSIPMTSKDAGALIAGWNIINPLGLPYPCSILRIVNQSKSDLLISYDGVVENDIVLQGTSATLKFEYNADPINKTLRMAKGTHVYVSGVASAGHVYLIGYY